MGVWIQAYSKLQLTDPHEAADECWDELGHIEGFAYAAHRRTAEGLADADKVSTFPSGTEYVGGRHYARTDETRELEVLSTSYSGYGGWRRLLASSTGKSPEQVWRDPQPTQPFVDLIHFADNEGCIGPIAAERLLADFESASRREAYDAALAAENEFIRQHWSGVWDRWHQGLSLAADGGLVQFH
jgi:hypothetical protein